MKKTLQQARERLARKCAKKCTFKTKQIDKAFTYDGHQCLCDNGWTFVSYNEPLDTLEENPCTIDYHELFINKTELNLLDGEYIINSKDLKDIGYIKVGDSFFDTKLIREVLDTLGTCTLQGNKGKYHPLKVYNEVGIGYVMPITIKENPEIKTIDEVLNDKCATDSE